MRRSGQSAAVEEVPAARTLPERGEVLAWLRQHPGLARKEAPLSALPTGFAELDDLLAGGWARGAITALSGSFGRTSVALASLAAATRRGEVVAWVDATDALDPRSLAAAGACLDRFLWVRIESQKLVTPSRRASAERRPGSRPIRGALRATDLILDARGFGAVVLDLTGLPAGGAGGEPKWWVRLTRRLAASSTVLLVLGEGEVAGFSAKVRIACKKHSRREVGLEILRRRGGAPLGMATVRFDDEVD